MVVPVLKDKPVVAAALSAGTVCVAGFQSAVQTWTHPRGVGRILIGHSFGESQVRKGTL